VTRIAVYGDWDGLSAPLRLGILHAQRGSNREIFEFEFDSAALAHPTVAKIHLDPRIGLFHGRQHPPQSHEGFGVFADASPDRWGRMLMNGFAC
jgi:serine/threonine-protein kinase HipA